MPGICFKIAQKELCEDEAANVDEADWLVPDHC